MQNFVKIEGFFEQLEFMLEYDGVECNIKLFAESFGYPSGPAQTLFVEIAGKSTSSEPLPGEIYGVGAGQAGGFETGGGSGRSQQFDFFARSVQVILFL